MNYELTQEQVINFARIVAKSGQDDWRIMCHDEECPDPTWEGNPLYYTAERFEIVDVHTPLPQSHYQRFMLVRTKQDLNPSVVLAHSKLIANTIVVLNSNDSFDVISVDNITDWMWPNTSWQSAISITPQVQVLETLRV